MRLRVLRFGPPKESFIRTSSSTSPADLSAAAEAPGFRRDTEALLDMVDGEENIVVTEVVSQEQMNHQRISPRPSLAIDVSAQPLSAPESRLEIGSGHRSYHSYTIFS